MVNYTRSSQFDCHHGTKGDQVLLYRHGERYYIDVGVSFAAIFVLVFLDRQ